MQYVFCFWPVTTRVKRQRLACSLVKLHSLNKGIYLSIYLAIYHASRWTQEETPAAAQSVVRAAAEIVGRGIIYLLLFFKEKERTLVVVVQRKGAVKDSGARACSFSFPEPQ
jgi:hypothetical protein